MYPKMLFYLFIQILLCDAKLRFVQIWFRHGERLPTHFLKFPEEDPNDLEFLNIGYPGELTNNGILQEFQLGEKLKKIYGSHFGQVYRPTEFHVFTGKDNRTSTSAQAFFAGFMPPTKNQTWNPALNWMPIAQETDPSIDWVSTGVFDDCVDTIKNSVEYLDVMINVTNADPELLELIKNNTGRDFNAVLEYNHAIDSLKSRALLNDKRLPVPCWARGFESRIFNISYVIHNSVVGVQNTTVGSYHVELVMSFFENYFLRNTTKGIFVSGHDTNILNLWKAFQLDGHPEDIPHYGSHMAIELHEIEGRFFVKFFLSMGYETQQAELIPVNCFGKTCTWEQLKNITMNWRKPREDWWFECKGIGKMSSQESTVTGTMFVILAILLLATIILGFTSFSYKRQLNNMRDPERARLLQ
ncbi:unnamed protein product [Caenorhabditis bovis]|uniref:Uncharacterized protein n=1 Tax=Caenorhabditis bovis TaxID=2654633 RepID=A0A8S1EFL7_9PELO|nr:unnamed protein product [Caenorhabditis bovis]